MSCSQPVVKPAVQSLVFFHTSKTQTNDGTDHKHKPNSWIVRKQWQPPRKPETIIYYVSPLPIQYTHILEKQLPAFCTTPRSSASLSVLIYLVLRCFYSTLARKPSDAVLYLWSLYSRDTRVRSSPRNSKHTQDCQELSQSPIFQNM